MKSKLQVERIDVREIRKRTGLTQKKFAERFGIPSKTLEKWEYHDTTPPIYIPAMIDYILNLEEEIKELEEKNMKQKG